jgi:hypothetical protein
MFQL